MPFYWCHATDATASIWHNIEAESPEDAAIEFWESNDCLPQSIDGRRVRVHFRTSSDGLLRVVVVPMHPSIGESDDPAYHGRP
jgi:hypothetical protein